MTTTLFTRTLATVSLLSLALGAGIAHAETLAVTGARILTAGPAGVIENGTIIITDNRITAVGAGLAVPEGARAIDAKGKTVTPGLIEANSALGFVEVSSLGDDLGSRNDAISASFDVRYGYNFRSQLIPVARLGGLTRAIALPHPAGAADEAHEHDTAGLETHREANLFGGMGAALDLSGSPEAVFRSNVAATVDLGEGGADAVNGGRGVTFVAFINILNDARYFAKNRAAYAKGEGRSLALSELDMEALVPVVEGKVPLVVHVDRAADILTVLKVAQEQKIRVIILGGAEAWVVADRIAAAKVPVIIDAVADLPDDFDHIGSRLDNAALLETKGVQVIITGAEGGSHRARETRYFAGNAVANGLSYDAAIKSMTLYPAQAFGLSTDLGSLEAGKLADLVIWSGDPLEPLSQPEQVFINGQSQSLMTRGLMLRDRYLPAVRAAAEAK